MTEDMLHPSTAEDHLSRSCDFHHRRPESEPAFVAAEVAVVVGTTGAAVDGSKPVHTADRTSSVVASP